MFLIGNLRFTMNSSMYSLCKRVTAEAPGYTHRLQTTEGLSIRLRSPYLTPTTTKGL